MPAKFTEEHAKSLYGGREEAIRPVILITAQNHGDSLFLGYNVPQCNIACM